MLTKKLHSSLLPQSFVYLATSAVLVAIVMCTHRPTLGQTAATAAAAAHSPTNPQLHWIIPHRNVRSQVARSLAQFSISFSQSFPSATATPRLN